MSLCSHALFLALAEDLSSEVSKTTYDSIICGKRVEPWPGISRREFTCIAVATSFYKKFVETTSPNADALAVEKFLRINLSCEGYVIPQERLLDELLIGELRKQLDDFLYPKGVPLVSGLNSILTESRTGPGASIGARGGDYYSKMWSSPLTCTSDGLYKAYSSYISHSPLMRDAENYRISAYGEHDVVLGNHLSCVPKTSQISRVICTEPSLNMFFQLGLGNLIEKRLKSYFRIDLASQQSLNRDLARIGSANDGVEGAEQFCTIDLESASDSIGLSMLRSVLPRTFFGYLELLRSKETRLPDGRRIPLHMVSTMGNGFTFPLQTMLFGCAVFAAYKIAGVKIRKSSSQELGNFGVNGDDIIVDRRAHSFVIRLLTLMGFIVNKEKSFFEGPFRESCGGDFFQGHPVRGIYVKDISEQTARYALINRINEWSALTGIYLPLTCSYLLKTVRFQPVPPWENMDAGLKVPFSFVTNLRKDRNTSSILYRRSVVRPARITFGDGIVKVPRGSKRREYNPSGLFLAFLQGSIKGGEINVRSDRALYRHTWSIAPSWDDTPMEWCDGRFLKRPITPFTWQQWNTAVSANFS